MSVVAISRQVGCLGEEIAEMVAGKLGYQVADINMIHQLAEGTATLVLKRPVHFLNVKFPRN